MTRVAWLSLVLAVLPVGASAAAWTDADRNLVVVAEPAARPIAATAAPGQPIALEYRVVELLSGETTSEDIAVIHGGLTTEERARLAAGERVILLASPDPAHPGRYVASSPLRATEAAIAAFRAWSDHVASRVAPAQAPVRSRALPPRVPRLPTPGSLPLGPPLSQRVDLSARRPAPLPVPLPPG